MELTRETLRELVGYDSTGYLYWRERPKKYFTSIQHWRQFNSKYANKECKPGSTDFKLLGKTVQKSRMVWLYHTGFLLDSALFKVLTVNRNVMDTRIENLVLVPTSVSNRQCRADCYVTHSTTKLLGVYWRPEREHFECQINDLDGNRIYKSFQNFTDAYWWRWGKHSEMHYKDLSKYKTGDVMSIPFEITQVDDIEPELPTMSYEFSEETRNLMAIKASQNHGLKSNNLKGYCVGYDMNTGDEVCRFIGGREMKSAGYNASHVYAVINGRKNHYRGLVWRREKI